MLSAVLSTGALLHRRFRRLLAATFLECLSAVGLLPLLLYPPSHYSIRLLLLFLLGVYLYRKFGQLRQARRSLKQLRLEDRFVRQRFQTAQLRQILHRRDHLWGQSLVLRSLKEILERPLSPMLRNDEKILRLAQRYRRVFQEMRPSYNHRDRLLLLPILLIWLGATPLPALNHAVLMVQSGLVAASIMLVAELVQIATLWALSRDFERFEQALSAWTLAERWDERLRRPTQGYNHTLLYEARPWFAGSREPSSPRSARDGSLREVA